MAFFLGSNTRGRQNDSGKRPQSHKYPNIEHVRFFKTERVHNIGKKIHRDNHRYLQTDDDHDDESFPAGDARFQFLPDDRRTVDPPDLRVYPGGDILTTKLQYPKTVQPFKQIHPSGSLRKSNLAYNANTIE